MGSVKMRKSTEEEEEEDMRFQKEETQHRRRGSLQGGVKGDPGMVAVHTEPQDGAGRLSARWSHRAAGAPEPLGGGVSE